ncbi:MAG: hypothetical protein ACKO23_07135, partial [Gemmataceae bacterium]
SAVTCASGRAGQVEPLTLPRQPLDVLCQQILGMCCTRMWSREELFTLVKRSSCFEDLGWKDFIDVVNYLLGRDQEGKSWVPARLKEVGDRITIRREKEARILRRNLGTILSENALTVRCEEGDTHREIGEVDEAYADRLQPGDRFLLDGRCLEYSRRDGAAVEVREILGRPRVPIWLGSGWPMASQLAERLFLLRTQAGEMLREGFESLLAHLVREYQLSGPTLEQLARFFQEQESISEIPGPHDLLVEMVALPCRETTYFLHTPLNRLANDALARVLVRRLARIGGDVGRVEVADLGFSIGVSRTIPDFSDRLRQLLEVENFEVDLVQQLSESEGLRNRFGRVAQTGLMVLRQPEGRKRKVGGSEWASRSLFDRVRHRDPNFVLMRQALAEMLEEVCDCRSALDYLHRLPHRTIRVRQLDRPSPFVRAWSQLEVGDGSNVQSPGESLKQLHTELMGEKGALAG